MVMPPPLAQKRITSPGCGPFALGNGVVQRHDHAGRAGVAPLVHHPVRLGDGLADQRHHRLDRAQVELREIVVIDVGEGQPGFVQRTLHQLRPVVGVEALGEFLDKFHLWPAELRHYRWRAGTVRAAGVDAQRVVEGTYGQQVARQEAWLLAHAQQRHARAVGKEVGRLLVGEVEEAAHAVAAGDEHETGVRLCHQVARPLIQRRDPARTRRVDIVAAGLDRAQLVLHNDRCARREIVGRVGGDDDQVELIRPHARARQRLFRRRHDQVRGRLFGRHPAALTDAHIFDQPLVGGRAQQRIDFGVGDDAFRHVAAGRQNHRIAQHGHVPTTSPPSTRSVSPVMNDASSDARKR
jgi:hypothetical protein